MIEKIDLYREVLELEPGSRVFFPLAKLLAENDEDLEAVKTLKLGLSRHPNFIEARLFLIELLAACGNESEIDVELNILENLFSNYPLFWQLWSKYLAKKPGMKDASLAVVFFAASLGGRELGWSEIIENGLKSMLSDLGREGKDPSYSSAYSSAYSKGYAQASGPDSSLGKTETKNDALGSLGEEKAAFVSEPASKLEDISEDMLEDMSEEMDEGEAFEELSAQDQDKDLPAGKAAFKAGTSPEAKKAIDKLPPAEIDTHDEAEEPFSLRTRSMAEVLAEQGDTKGALDIFKELMDTAPLSEQNSLKERMRELSESAGLKPAVDLAASEKDKKISVGEDLEGNRLVSVLESLAQRFENRAEQ